MSHFLCRDPAVWTVPDLPVKPWHSCVVCGRVGARLQQQQKRLKRCNRCYSTLYCGLGCQKMDWSDHKKRCKPIARALAHCKETQKACLTAIEDQNEMAIHMKTHRHMEAETDLMRALVHEAQARIDGGQSHRYITDLVDEHALRTLRLYGPLTMNQTGRCNQVSSLIMKGRYQEAYDILRAICRRDTTYARWTERQEISEELENQDLTDESRQFFIDTAEKHGDDAALNSIILTEGLVDPSEFIGCMEQGFEEGNEVTENLSVFCFRGSSQVQIVLMLGFLKLELFEMRRNLEWMGHALSNTDALGVVANFLVGESVSRSIMAVDSDYLLDQSRQIFSFIHTLDQSALSDTLQKSSSDMSLGMCFLRYFAAHADDEAETYPSLLHCPVSSSYSYLSTWVSRAISVPKAPRALQVHFESVRDTPDLQQLMDSNSWLNACIVDGELKFPSVGYHCLTSFAHVNKESLTLLFGTRENLLEGLLADRQKAALYFGQVKASYGRLLRQLGLEHLITSPVRLPQDIREGHSPSVVSVLQELVAYYPENHHVREKMTLLFGCPQFVEDLLFELFTNGREHCVITDPDSLAF